MMTKTEFMGEGMDLKRLALLFKKKLAVILLAALCGACAGGGIYLLVREMVMEPSWETRSQFYVRFVFNPKGDVEQYYNAYTWNDIIHGDPVIDRIVEAIEASDDARWADAGMMAAGLPDAAEQGSAVGQSGAAEQGSAVALPDTSEQESAVGGRPDYAELVRAAIKGEIISDTRLLTVTVATADRELATMIQAVTETGLLRFAEGQEEIVSMELIHSFAPERVVWDDRTPRAVIGGGVLTLVIALFVWWFAYILDDSLYVIADSEKRYPFPLLGLLIKNRTETEVQPYAGELAENVAHLLADEHKLLFLSVENAAFFVEKNKDSESTIYSSEKGKDSESTVYLSEKGKDLESTGYSPQKSEDATSIAYPREGSKDSASDTIKTSSPDAPAERARTLFDTIMKAKVSGKTWETTTLPAVLPPTAPDGGRIGPALRDADGIILVVPFGKRNGKKIDKTVSFLRNQDCKILGILITEGDRIFWRLYYGSRRK